MTDAKNVTEVAKPAEETAPAFQPVPGLVFDFNRMTARQYHNLLEIIRGRDVLKKCELFAGLCVSVPEGWGDPNNPDTFFDLPLKGDCGFIAVQQTFINAFGDPAKN